MPDGSLPPTRTTLVPPLKWAGGKRWLVNRLADKLPLHHRLIEPFAGSAAMLFRLQPASAIIADCNAELINVYECIRDSPSRLYEAMKSHAEHHSKDYYYTVRSNVPSCDVAMAARTLYLNRTCWNALYRVNKKGEFNVPIGTKTRVLMDSDDFRGTSTLLHRCDISVSDFSETISRAGNGDLIFADPPYFSNSVKGTFVKYNASTFCWADQERLSEDLLKAHSRGAQFVLTNTAASELVELYGAAGHLSRVSRQTVISGSAKGRGEAQELLWTSFPLEL
jgi:DNA adenine methylase